MNVTAHDTTRCLLGEGAFWHPERQQFYWCDILSNRVLTREQGMLRDWTFDTQVSCLGWVDRDRLIAATARAIVTLDVESGTIEPVCDLERDHPGSRSNDGRADPHGGFWLGTMSLAKEPAAGAIYRYYKGELRKVVPGLSIPNAICFAPDGRTAYYSDTPEKVIRQLSLGVDGWPEGESAIAVDLRDTPHVADGAVCDAEGNIWTAQWGSSRVGVYSPAGDFLRAVGFPALQTSCPAFGGSDLTTLFCTSAAIGIEESEIAANPGHGRTFRVEGAGRGVAEHRVEF